MDLELSTRELLAEYERILAELRRREIIRTNDAPAGQYAEWLAREVLGGELAPNSTKSYDLTTPDGQRLQVKARVLRNDVAGERLLSPFRSFDFDQALVLLFDVAYRVKRATLLPADLIRDNSAEDLHSNARRFVARDAVLALGVDVTHLFND